MQINQISNNSFEGRVYYNKNMPKTMKNYAETLLNTKFKNQTLREKLAKKTFDLTFFTTSSKKAIKPKLEFYSGFKVLNPKDKKYYNSRVRIGDDFYKNATKISDFIDLMEDRKQAYSGYNTLGEKFKLWFDEMVNKFLNDW